MKTITTIIVAMLAVAATGTTALAPDRPADPRASWVIAPSARIAQGFEQSFGWTGPYAGTRGSFGWASASNGLFIGAKTNSLQRGQNGRWKIGRFVPGAGFGAQWTSLKDPSLKENDTLTAITLPAPRSNSKIARLSAPSLRAAGDAALSFTGGAMVLGTDFARTLALGHAAAQPHPGDASWTLGAGVELALTPQLAPGGEYFFARLSTGDFVARTWNGDPGAQALRFAADYQMR
jgi:opacity protein-like surface antigen